MDYNLSNNIIFDLKEYRRSPSPGANASRPKYQIITPNGDVYFKFKMTNNEMCAEIFAYHLGEKMKIPVAITKLATYKQELGIVSYDIGSYIEPDDLTSYSIKDFLNIRGFADMCLFDYVIMNGDSKRLNKLLYKRIKYMEMKVGEFSEW